MDPRSEIGAFLTTRRARISPEQARLSTGGRRRRVPGLRRAEVAVLAGISCDYYTRLEQGHVGAVSDSVLEGLATALQLDEAEYAHLIDLVQATRMPARRRDMAVERAIHRNVQHVLDTISAPALLHNARLDILAANRLGRALHSPIFADTGLPVNHARFLFLDPLARAFYAEWDEVAGGTVPLLRTEHARNPDDAALADMIAELSSRSRPFKIWWDTHDVRFFGSPALVRHHHPVVGDLELTFEALEIVSDRRLTIAVFTAEPGSASEHKLELLAQHDDAVGARRRPSGSDRR